MSQPTYDFTLLKEQETPKPFDQGQGKTPVYIMSPMQRCGTNHLADIVLLHPDFQLPKVLEEDFVFEHADLLYEYGEKTGQRWRRLGWIDNADEYRRQLEIKLGQALLSFLVRSNRRKQTSSAQDTRLQQHRQIFPVLAGSEAVAVDKGRAGCSRLCRPEVAKTIGRALDAAVGSWGSADS